MKSRADYFRKRRIGRKNFSVYIEENVAEKLYKRLQSKQLTKTEWLKEQITEVLKMDLNWKLNCPYCGEAVSVDLSDYVTDVSTYERQMGTETESTIECSEFKCPSCSKEFEISGSVWEYPEGTYNDDDIQAIPTDDDDEKN